MSHAARLPPPRMTAEEFLGWPGDGSGRRFHLVDGEISSRDRSGSWNADPDAVARGDRLLLAGIGLDCELDDLYRKTWLLRSLA